METNEIKNRENSRKLSVRYFNTLKPVTDKTEMHIAEIMYAGIRPRTA